MIYLTLALIGLIVGGLINVLADDLPARRRPNFPTHPFDWLVTLRVLLGRETDPDKQTRGMVTEICTAAVFAFIPTIYPTLPVLAVVAFYFAVLILIIIIDLEHRLILHIVTFPATLMILILSIFELGGNTLWQTAMGAVTGYLIFYVLYWIGRLTYGAGALGFGDVTLSMTLGAMVGVQLIVFTLVIGILIGGVSSLLLVLTGRSSRHSHIPYGEFLAVAGMIMLLWGYDIVRWYFG